MNSEKVVLLKKHTKRLLYQLCIETGDDYIITLEDLLWELDEDIKKAVKSPKPQLHLVKSKVEFEHVR